MNLWQIIRENIFNLYGKEVPFSCEVSSIALFRLTLVELMLVDAKFGCFGELQWLFPQEILLFTSCYLLISRGYGPMHLWLLIASLQKLIPALRCW